MTLRVGISACVSHPDPNRQTFKNKALFFAERSMMNWVMAGGAVPCLLPPPQEPMTAEALIASVDGLLLPGGPDINPQTYGELPKTPQGGGDAMRDAYELELVRAALARRLPIFGVCRGMQLLNVALGGSVCQELSERLTSPLKHSDDDIREALQHGVTLVPGSRLADLYGGRQGGRTNSVHHQAVGRVGRDLMVEARADDGVIEALRADDGAQFVAGVQWHPEFSRAGDGLLDATVLRDDFLDAARTWRA